MLREVIHCKPVYTYDTLLDMEELLTIVQVAEVMKVSKMTIYRYIKAGKLQAIKAGRDYRVRKIDFEKFLEKSKNK